MATKTGTHLVRGSSECLSLWPSRLAHVLQLNRAQCSNRSCALPHGRPVTTAVLSPRRCEPRGWRLPRVLSIANTYKGTIVHVSAVTVETINRNLIIFILVIKVQIRSMLAHCKAVRQALQPHVNSHDGAPVKCQRHKSSCQPFAAFHLTLPLFLTFSRPCSLLLQPRSIQHQKCKT